MNAHPPARQPATVGRLFAAIGYAIGIIQASALGLVFLWTLVNPLVYGRSGPPGHLYRGWEEWVLVIDVVLCLLSSIVVYVLYRRGALDEYSHDLRRSRPRPPR